MSRVCTDCWRDLPRTSYTSNQWYSPVGLSRCAGCVHGHPFDTPAAHQSGSGRYNNSDAAEFDEDALDNPFASGAFRWVAKGVYTSGARSGQACVLKWFKAGVVFEVEYFALDIEAVDKALEVVNRFNELNIVNKDVKINVPAVWEFVPPSSRAGQRALIEPFIQNYKKFNSNSGWNDVSGTWHQVMQALSRRCNSSLTLLTKTSD